MFIISRSFFCRDFRVIYKWWYLIIFQSVCLTGLTPRFLEVIPYRFSWPHYIFPSYYLHLSGFSFLHPFVFSVPWITLCISPLYKCLSSLWDTFSKCCEGCPTIVGYYWGYWFLQFESKKLEVLHNLKNVQIIQCSNTSNNREQN